MIIEHLQNFLNDKEKKKIHDVKVYISLTYMKCLSVIINHEKNISESDIETIHNLYFEEENLILGD
jgi:hypothetical protein